MTQVQTYLQSHSLLQLRLEKGIKNSAKVGDRFFSLNYDQIESKPSEMVNGCRGLILSVPTPLTAEQVQGSSPIGDTTILARPFERFFNMGDVNAAPIDLNDPKTMFYEKLDGTLCIVYFNTVLEQWCVATRAVPLADKPMTGWDNLTFRGLFEQALFETLLRNDFVHSQVNEQVCFKVWSNLLDKSKTYMFELTTPMNRIVVNYPVSTVWLLGYRDTQTGEDHDVSKIGTTFAGVPICPSYPLNDLASLVAFVGSRPPFEQEGVVVRLGSNRVKVKSLAYMAYNRVRDSAANSPRAIMELILTEKLDDVFPVLEPYIQKQALTLQEGVRSIYQTMDLVYEGLLVAIKDQPNPRKAFALEVQARKLWMAPLMDRFIGRCTSFSDYVEKRKAPDGSYPDGFLEALISQAS
jgi:hypothetical protein